MKTVICSKIEVKKGQYKIVYLCVFCGVRCEKRESHFLRYEKHYCSRDCYSQDRKRWPKEKQHKYGTGFSIEEREKRKKCRSKTNHAIRDGHLKRMPCEVCGDETNQTNWWRYSV